MHPVAFQLPNYWDLLNEFDKYHYNCLRIALSNPNNKNQRNKRVENFQEAMMYIKNYAIRGDMDDWKRCLVCGICWLPEGIGINTHQLRILIFKCKSSINGSLQKMRYTFNLGRSEAGNAVARYMPILRNNSSELRQWTVRQLEDLAPKPEIRPLVESNQQIEKINSKNNSAEEPLPINLDGQAQQIYNYEELGDPLYSYGTEALETDLFLW